MCFLTPLHYLYLAQILFFHKSFKAIKQELLTVQLVLYISATMLRWLKFPAVSFKKMPLSL